TVKEIANLAFLQGNIGKPGAGLFPVRGHSNVQGDRTMGIWERPPSHFLDALRDEFHFEPPRENGFDSVAAVKAFRDGSAKVFFGLGGNFVSAMSDTEVTEAALSQADLTVQVSTKVNRSHLVHGKEALILPPLGRSEKDLTGGRRQRVTVEDSVCAVHSSKGPLAPASPHLRSEVDIVCTMALATLGANPDIPWAEFRDDYSAIRRRIARVVPGCAAYEEKIDQPGGFVLPHPPRDTRTFPTEKDRAIFTVSPTEVLHVPEGRLLLQTMRSHDQFNTVIYGLDDRYRGIKNGRRVVFVNPQDMVSLGLEEGQMVDIVSEWKDGSERRAPRFRVVTYDTPRGCTGAYYPEANALVPLDSKADGSNQPAYKSVVVRLEARGDEQSHGRTENVSTGGSVGGRGDEEKRYVEPHHLS
ncbi:MAG: oxidoreductase alpha (molybdopterin) subunit, partial [Nocardioides sp.]|nr:oxidoreductase alpha (molybdopterin) subunit [Nocardioides sp.]